MSRVCVRACVSEHLHGKAWRSHANEWVSRVTLMCTCMSWSSPCVCVCVFTRARIYYSYNACSEIMCVFILTHSTCIWFPWWKISNSRFTPQFLLHSSICSSSIALTSPPPSSLLLLPATRHHLSPIIWSSLSRSLFSSVVPSPSISLPHNICDPLSLSGPYAPSLHPLALSSPYFTWPAICLSLLGAG